MNDTAPEPNTTDDRSEVSLFVWAALLLDALSLLILILFYLEDDESLTSVFSAALTIASVAMGSAMVGKSRSRIKWPAISAMVLSLVLVSGHFFYILFMLLFTAITH